jgi:endonuclease YncB( thermonuclease family)
MKLTRTFIKYLAVILLVYLPAIAQTKVLKGMVVGVADGDTITVLDADNKQHRVRLQGIDAPEKDQDFGNVAKERLSDLVFGKQVTVLFEKTDQYGRLLGKVVVDAQGAQKDAAEEMLWSGLAWHYKYYEREQSVADRETYNRVEMFARGKKRSLWTDKSPTPPWDFRRSKKSSKERAEAEDGTENGAAGPAQPAQPATAPAPSGTVNVRGHYRKDGTYVRPHTRSAPRRRN